MNQGDGSSSDPLSTQLDRFDAMLQSLTVHWPDVVLRLDLQGRIHYMNRDLVSWKTVCPEEYVGNQFEDCGLPIGIITEWGQWIQQVIATLEPVERTVEFEQEKKVRHLEFRLFPELRSNGSLETLLVMCRDRSEALARERALRESELRRSQLEMLGIVASGIAHNFNNALVAILGQTSILKEDLGKDHVVFPRLLMIERASHRAKDMASQLQTFSSGGTPVKTVFEVSLMLVQETNLVLAGTNVKASFHIHDCGYIEADHGQLSQVIHNLVLNAREAMRDGGECRIRARRYVYEELPLFVQRQVNEGEKDWIQIDCKDHGEGILPEHVSKVFDPYFTQKRGGSGIGLTSCRSIAHAHHGVITVESVQGEGSLFSLFLPSQRYLESRGIDASHQVHQGSGTILIMDDDIEVGVVLGDMVERCGYTYEFVDNGRDAVRVFERAWDKGKGFTLVLLDLTIPGEIGGLEVLRKLRQVDPDVKAIVVSGYADGLVLANFRESGFVGRVKKPFELSEMSAALQAAVLPSGG